MELFNEVNEIRKRAYLLPRDAMVHKLSVPQNGEHTYAAYNEYSYRDLNDVRPDSYHEDWEFYNSARQTVNDFWTIPDFQEIHNI